MLTGFLNTLATIISVTSLLIVTYGALIGVISFFRNELKRLTGNYSITNIRKLRAVFGTYLLLGLEFLIASDILKTVLEPTLNELAILGGIVVAVGRLLHRKIEPVARVQTEGIVIRNLNGGRGGSGTVNAFLNKEIKELETENKDTE